MHLYPLIVSAGNGVACHTVEHSLNNSFKQEIFVFPYYFVYSFFLILNKMHLYPVIMNLAKGLSRLSYANRQESSFQSNFHL